MKNRKWTFILWMAQAPFQYCLLRFSDTGKNQVNKFCKHIFTTFWLQLHSQMFPPLSWFSEGPQREETVKQKREARGALRASAFLQQLRLYAYLWTDTPCQCPEAGFAYCFGLCGFFFFFSNIVPILMYLFFLQWNSHLLSVSYSTHTCVHTHTLFHSQNHDCLFEFHRGGGEDCGSILPWDQSHPKHPRYGDRLPIILCPLLHHLCLFGSLIIPAGGWWTLLY